MAERVLDSLMAYLRHLKPEGESTSDGALLQRFVCGDQGAFASLVRRHGQLVWGVCARLLPVTQDAEDAFQAAFLVLARKAKSLRGTGPLAPWLYTVAYRAAAKARVRSARYQTLRSRFGSEQDGESAPSPDVLWQELRGILDEEVNRLPEKHRLPVLLCYFEGLTNEQAAQRLACPKGTILSRLARARDRLRERLVERGLDLPGAALVLALSGVAASASPPKELIDVTAKVVAAAPAALASTVLNLAHGVTQGMLFSKIRIATLVILGLGFAGTATSMISGHVFSPKESAAAETTPMARANENKGNPPGDKKAPADEEKAREPEKREEGKRHVKQTEIQLSKEDEFSPMEVDPGLTLDAILQDLAKKKGVRIFVNEKAFSSEDLLDVNKSPITDSRSLPGGTMTFQARLSQILSRIPAQSGAAFMVRKDHIEITTMAKVREELGLPPDSPLLPLVTESFDKTPLADAFRRLADASEYSVVLDGRSQAKVKEEMITARLANVPVNTAVELLADMAGLDVVRRNNVFYVTSPENATRLRAKLKSKR
jgi:RNA polymerase sigma factor (sigma-70 family)